MWALGPHTPAQPASVSWSPAEPRQGWPSCLCEPWGHVVGEGTACLATRAPALPRGLGDVMGPVVDGETSHALITGGSEDRLFTQCQLLLPVSALLVPSLGPRCLG